MKDKTQDVNSLEELSKAADALQKCIVVFGNELSRALDDIKALKKEEDTWEMKCPYKLGKKTWFIYSYGNVDCSFWLNSSEDNDKFSQGNIFPTKEAAELESKRRNLLTRFRAFRDECNGNWKLDWKSHLDSKYYISFVGKAKLVIFYTGTTNNFQLFGFFKNKADCERAIELFGDEIKELFVEGDA